MEKQTVVVALSGGVDSAVAALLIKKKYKVIGAFMKNFSDTKNPFTNECNWREEYKAAQKVALQLQIPLHLFDFEKEYKSLVIKPMIQAYKQGLTPNPDIPCNTTIKFPLFWKEAKTLGAQKIAFGHYAQIQKSKQGYHLLQGKDQTKDQSYFLSELSQQDLKHTLFPLGNLTKNQVRTIAKKHSLSNWNRPSTKGICFVGNIPLKQFLEKSLKHKTGILKDHHGKTIGTHPGSFYFTIGQRIGPHLDMTFNEKFKNQNNKRWFIAKKQGNTLIVAPEDHLSLYAKKIKLINLHQINQNEKIPKVLKARTRHLAPLQTGKLNKHNNTYTFTFSKPQKALAPGQYLVLYHKNALVASAEMR